jgi:hypothetical protein
MVLAIIHEIDGLFHCASIYSQLHGAALQSVGILDQYFVS